MRHPIAAVVAVVVLGLAPRAIGAQSSASIAVWQSWACASIGTARPTAACPTLVDNGGATARLAGLKSPVAGRAEAHRTVRSYAWSRQ